MQTWILLHVNHVELVFSFLHQQLGHCNKASHTFLPNSYFNVILSFSLLFHLSQGRKLFKRMWKNQNSELTPLFVFYVRSVEKAAMVFSLKLESGHKLLCPWINSACSEELAQFPTVSWDDLVEDYKKRYDALSQLTALPVISPVAVDNMRNPMLENFLREFSTSVNLVPDETCRKECVLDEPDSISSVSFYQVCF